MSPHCDILRNAEDSTLFFFQPLSHISFLFTSLPCTLLCFLFLPHRISHKKSLYMPKNTLTLAIWDSSTWAKEGSLFLIFRNKQLCSFSLACICKAAYPSAVECELRLVVHHNGCYSHSFICGIRLLFHKEKELNGAGPNTAVLMLINVGNRSKKNPFRPLEETKNEKRGKQMWVRPLFCFQLITLSAHWQEEWSAEEETQQLLNGSLWFPDNSLSYLWLWAHKE